MKKPTATHQLVNCSGCGTEVWKPNMTVARARKYGQSLWCGKKCKSKANYWLDVEANRARNREYRTRPEKVVRYKETAKRWRARNREHLHEYCTAWKRNNPDRTRLHSQASGKRYRRKLAEPYVRRLLSQKSTIQRHEWPPEVVELKRIQIKIRREISDAQKH